MNYHENYVKVPSESDVFAYLVYSTSRECIKINVFLIVILCVSTFVFYQNQRIFYTSKIILIIL